MAVRPFRIQIADEQIDDLRRRLRDTRWPDEPDGAGWSYGASLAYVRELVEYWRESFDFSAMAERLNQWPHFKAHIKGLDIHFVHLKRKPPGSLPIVLTHGWPSSFVELLELGALLTEPRRDGADAGDAFEVVIPSLPGFGFSDQPRQPGMTKAAVADLWVPLMKELGHPRFAAHGGDIGAGVTSQLGLRHPDRLIGIHVTSVIPPYLGPGSPPLSEAERRYQSYVDQWDEQEGAYAHVQRTRPQTLAYGLNDSPAGLAAWIVEMFRAWSECEGNVENRFSKDELLTNVSIYWFTQTINSSIRMYLENRRHLPGLRHDQRIAVPCGVALTREEVDRPPREWALRSYSRLLQWTEMPRGGHFLASEEPQLLAEDIRRFFRQCR